METRPAGEAQEDPIKTLIQRDTRNALKGSTALYLISAPILILATRAFLAFFHTPLTTFPAFYEIYIISITLLALVTYLWLRFHPASTMRIQLYLLGILGLSIGGGFFLIGAPGFLSSAYWRGQAELQDPKCTRDGGELAVLGGRTLVCLKCSRVPRVGFETPK